ncbi:MAG TPA: ATP-binding cassette domain-containing protein [Paracoccaceae bacterium]|nr:ATP-binding cassette domain-containing protein [Paracoccaceae bacterium]
MSRMPAVLGQGRVRRIAAVAGLALGQAIAAGGAAFATRDAFAALRDGAPTPWAALAAVAGAGLVIAGLRVAERATAERVGCDYAAELRERLFLRGMRMPVGALADRTTGGLSLRFVGDLAAVRGWVSKGLARLISAGVAIPVTFLALALLHPLLAAAAFVPSAVAVALIAVAGGPLERAHARLRRRRAGLAASLTERLSQGAALRMAGRLTTERERLRTRSTEIAEAAVARARLSAAVRAVPDAAAGLAAALVLAAAAHGGASAAEAAGALAALALLGRPLRQLGEVHDRRQAWRVARMQVERALAAPALPSRDGDRSADRDGAPALRLQGLCLAGRTPLDAELPAGRIAWLVGPPGSGKSALLAVCAGLERPVEGRVEVLGNAPWRLPTGAAVHVGPAAPLLRGSLRRNLALGVGRSVDDTKIAAAVSRAGLDGLSRRLGGLSGRVGEGGRGLSSTERGRVMLVRVMLAEPHLCIVDADEARLDAAALDLLLEILSETGSAALIASDRPAVRAEAHLVWRLDEGGAPVAAFRPPPRAA